MGQNVRKSYSTFKMSHAFDEIKHQENNVIYCNLGKLEGAERSKGPDTP